MKKQRSFWLENSDWNKFLKIIEEQGFFGKGKSERFLRKLISTPFIFVEGSGSFKITALD